MHGATIKKINDPNLMKNLDLMLGHLQGLCAAYVANYMLENPHIIKMITYYNSENEYYN